MRVLLSSMEPGGPCQADQVCGQREPSSLKHTLVSSSLREALKSQPQIKTYECFKTMKNFPNKRGGTLRHVLNEWSDFRD